MKDLNGRTLLLGFQHTFVMFGATVLVPILTGLDVGVTLIAAGIGTWFFHIITKFKVPVFLGSSFAFLPGIFAIKGMEGGSLAEACGGIVWAGLIYVVVAVLFKFVLKYETLHKILPSHVTGPVIMLIGLMLASVAIANANGTYSGHIVEKYGVGGCWFIALVTFAIAIFVKVFFDTRNKLVSMLPVLIALICGYILSMIMGVIDFSSISNASWVGMPKFTTPQFTGRGFSIMVPIAVVTVVEHFGDILAIGNVAKKDFIKDPGIHRTLMGDGIATSISALIGGPANTTYSENTGAIAITGNANPLIMRVAACCAIILGVVPKFTALIGTIPAPVIGGISILLFGMISSIGAKNMVEERVNFNNPKVLMIAASILVLGVGGAEFDFGPISLKGLGLAALVGVVLNLILNVKKEEAKLQD